MGSRAYWNEWPERSLVSSVGALEAAAAGQGSQRM